MVDNATLYWKDLNVDGWADEMYDMKYILNKYGKVDLNHMKGLRVPFLISGGNNQFEMMNRKESQFEYDSTFTTYQNDSGWPYTMDSGKVSVGPNFGSYNYPNCSFKGTWINPMIVLKDKNDVLYGMLDDALKDPAADKNTIMDMLQSNYDSAKIKKQPFGIYAHASLFKRANGQEFLEGYLEFITKILKEDDDVWIVPISVGIEYMKNPMSKSELANNPHFQCNNYPKSQCDDRTDCKYVDIPDEVPNPPKELYLSICGTQKDCPPVYPWLRDRDGNNGLYHLYNNGMIFNKSQLSIFITVCLMLYLFNQIFS